MGTIFTWGLGMIFKGPFTLIISTLYLCFSPVCAVAGDLGFRYLDGKCVNDKGQPGYNTVYFGQCTNFRGAKIGSLKFVGVDFSGSLFEGADMQLTQFENAILVGTNFEGANISGSTFANSDLSQANFSGAIVRKVSFYDVLFEKAIMKGLQAQESLFTFLKLDNLDLSDGNFVKANFESANLQNSNLSGGKFMEATFKDANLYGTQLMGGDFTGANFSSVQAEGADMSNGDFDRVTFQKARLKGASFKEARLVRALFQGAFLDGIQWKNAQISRKTEFDFSLERAVELGMVLSFSGDILAEFGGRTYYKVPVEGTMLDLNLFKSCQKEALEIPCINETNGTYSDSKCFDVGWRENTRPMETISKEICAGRQPSGCMALEGVFQYMGEKYNGRSCGVVGGAWCAPGDRYSDRFTICVE